MILNHPSILQKFSLSYTSPTSNNKVLEHSNLGTKRLDSKSKIIFGTPPLSPSHPNPNTHTLVTVLEREKIPTTGLSLGAEGGAVGKDENF